MNTKDTPFAESFGNYGDPRRYMGGASPAKKVEKFVEKIKNSPLANLAGILLAGGEQSSPTSTPAPALGQGISAPVVPPIGLNPNASSGLGIKPGSFQIPNLVMPQIGSPMMPTQVPDADGDGKVDSFWGIKANTPPTPSPQSSAAPFVSQPIADVTNKTDFNPLAPDTSNQVAVSGNDYMNVPGYGSLKEKMGKLSMLMGMG
jgi:hypothetical protein